MSLINLSSRPKTKKDKQVSLERPIQKKKNTQIPSKVPHVEILIISLSLCSTIKLQTNFVWKLAEHTEDRAVACQ